MKNIVILRRISLSLTIVIIAAMTLVSCEDDEVFSTNLALNNEEIKVPNTKITSKVIVFSDTDWQVELEDFENTTWLSLSPDEFLTKQEGNGTNYFSFTVSENTSGAERLGTFVIRTSSSKKTLVIRQAK